MKTPMGNVAWFILPLLVVAVFGLPTTVDAASLEQYGLQEGDVIRASDDLDVYIVNEHGYKRLFVNEAIFGIYGHLGFDKVKIVTPDIRDAFPTSGLFRNCESGSEQVSGLDVVGSDTANLRWVNTSGAQAAQDDPDFFKKVFCINNAEQKLYGVGAPYESISDVPRYDGSSNRVALMATAAAAAHTPASVYASWAKSVAQLLCFEFDGGAEVSQLWGGSGTVMRNRTGALQLLTNRHVVPGDGFCLAELWVDPGVSFDASDKTIIYAAEFSEHLSTLQEDDEAIMLLEPVSNDLIRTFEGGGLISSNVLFPRSLDQAAAIAKTNVCGVSDAHVGDEVAVIGFPSIGSSRGPTLTRGSLAGREATYYVTDAKIERGNSGGAAILIKNSCYLGIPTFVVSGEHESLGRILDITRFPVFAKVLPTENDDWMASIIRAFFGL